MARKTKAEKRDVEFRDALISQLKARKADTPFFLEMVNELLYLRVQLRELKALVSSGGIVVSSQGRNGNVRLSINEALREIRDTDKTMMMMLKEMKITTDNIIPEDEDDEL